LSNNVTRPIQSLIDKIEDAARSKTETDLRTVTEEVIGCSIECWNLNVDKRDERNELLKQEHANKLKRAEQHVQQLLAAKNQNASSLVGGEPWQPMDQDGEPVATRALELQVAQDALLELRAAKCP